MVSKIKEDLIGRSLTSTRCGHLEDYDYSNICDLPWNLEGLIVPQTYPCGGLGGREPANYAALRSKCPEDSRTWEIPVVSTGWGK